MIHFVKKNIIATNGRGIMRMATARVAEEGASVYSFLHKLGYVARARGAVKE